MLRVCTAHFSMRPSFPAFKKEAKQKNSPTSFIHQPTICTKALKCTPLNLHTLNLTP